jgi:GDP/UDP-N,N'-diacetylbacillosamine 2-epimerase (hydrolysing)
MKKVCFFTGTRAEYGLLKPLMEKFKEDKEFQLQIIASGMHLSPEFGLTYKQIEEDGFIIDEKVENLLSADTDTAISKSIGLGIISYTDALSRLNPDLLIVLGDRYETFAAVIAAYTMKIPVAHLHGGETTEGAYDEAYRHSISKMSYFHFASTEEYRKRIIQLGESPDRVFNVGAIGLDNIKNMDFLSKDVLEKDLDFKFGEKNILMTFHPTTLENNNTKEQIKEILKALDKRKDLNIIFTKSNSDSNGRIINEEIEKFVKKNKDRSKIFSSLGVLRYLTVLNHVDLVMGNSSSGIIEVPMFKIPTINIGDRQKGRLKPDSVIDCECKSEDILEAINKAYDPNFLSKIRKQKNIFGEGNTSETILKILKKELNKRINLKKSFYDLEE